MRLPYRKPGKYAHTKKDPHITQERFDALTKDLERLKTVKKPHAMKEVSRLGEMGDFSENAEYQIAKGKLRGINNAILRIEHELNHAVIISATKDGSVSVGSTVTVETDGKQKSYSILGSNEADPGSGKISQHSPIGEALIGKRAGDSVILSIGGKEKELKILYVQ